jgi:hypothetical protein
MSVGINTNTAGTQSGTIKINLTSDGTGTSGLGNTNLTNQTINVSGTVFDHAVIANQTISTPHVTQGQSVNFSYALSNPLGGSALRDGATVSTVSPDANGYASGFAGPVNIASGGSSALFTGTFTPQYGGPASQQFTFTYGDQDQYAGYNSNQTATLTVNAQVDALVELTADNSNAVAAGRPLLSGLGDGQGASRGYLNVPSGTGQVMFAFNSGSDLASLESDLTAFHYTWYDASGNYSLGDGTQNSGNSGLLSVYNDYQMEVDLSGVSATDPVLDFDFSKYSGLEIVGVAVAVPEPSILGLLGAGAGGMLLRRRRIFR